MTEHLATLTVLKAWSSVPRTTLGSCNCSSWEFDTSFWSLWEHAQMHKHEHIHIYIHTRSLINTHIHTPLTHSCLHAFIHMYTHGITHTSIHPCAHTYTDSHFHALTFPLPVCRSFRDDHDPFRSPSVFCHTH